MKPNSFVALREYIYTKLGSPVIEINVSDSQVDSCIQDALDLWQEYHSDGTQRYYIAHQITQQEKDQKYIELSEDIYTVNRTYIGRDGVGFSGSGIFSPIYQFTLSDMFSGGFSADIGGYYIGKMYLDTLKDTLEGLTTSVYKRYENRLYIEVSWSLLPVDSFIMIDVHAFLNPEEFPRIYGDRVFRKLAVAYTKKQWGTNLSKFQNMQLSGGVILNGRDILSEADSDIAEIEQNFQRNYSDPDLFFIG